MNIDYSSKLIEACHSSDFESIIAYHEQGQPLDIVTGKTRLSLMHYAAAGGFTNLVLWLLEKKAPFDLKQKIGRTPLHLACEIGKIEIIVALLKAGAEINAQDNAGFTPLHLACSEHPKKLDPTFRAELALKLFALGANPKLRNNENHLPSEYLDHTELKRFDCMENLPPFPRDVWVSIFEFLPKKQVITSIRQVCRAFHNLSTFTLVTNFYKN